ncbi:MAG: cytoplasmic protein [Pelagibacterium sp. SCN 64-44]|nr:MAG: cytoplasmic protein [Pelagibacterium sp. SCN 64-44]
MTQPLLMPKATAVWLVDNTALSFEQIAAFCTLHPLEVQGIADGDVAGGIMGVNPIQNGQLTREEIERGEADANYRLKLSEPKVERPNAIKWLVRNHPELKDAQIMRLVGTTKSTIESVRESTHWNSANLTAMDPVTLGLCSQIDLDLEVKRASKGTAGPDEVETGTVLLTAEEALARAGGRAHADMAEDDFGGAADERSSQGHEEFDADSVFSKLKSLKSDTEE